MHILAFDTCFAACSAAVTSRNGSDLLASRFEAMDRGHSERLVPMIAAVLAEASVTLGDIGALAVTVGPGSFTGVRTGLSVARGLALATGLPIVGTTSLHVIAASIAGHDADRPSAVAIATRDGLVYFQRFAAATADALGEARLATVSEAAAEMADAPHAITGSAAAAIAAWPGGRRDHCLPETASQAPDAAWLARLATRLPRLQPANPLYLRAADAKPQAPQTEFILATRS